MHTLIKNVRLVSPDTDLENVTISIKGAKIEAIYEAAEAPNQAETLIDANGLIAMPGFFDIHSHGADGCDTVDCNTENIRHIAKKKLAEGVTTWLPTTLTLPQDHLVKAAEHVAAYMANQEYAKTPGLHVEGPFINPKCTGAQNPEFVRLPNLAELQEIHSIAPALIVSIAPEMAGAAEFIEAATKLGIRCSAAHTAATYSDFTQAKQAGLTHLTHFCNQMSPLHHREIGLVGAGMLDPDIKIEIICDTIHLCPDMLKLVFSLKPIDQMMLITDSMAGSWLADGDIELGGLPVVVSDGIARVKETGALAGSTLRFNHGVRHVAQLTNLALSELVKATSWNQAQSLGLTHCGKLTPGFAADIVLMDANFDVKTTIVDGEVRYTA